MPSFFDDLSEKVTKLGQDASRKKKKFTDSMKINGQINEQKANLSRLYEDLGRKVYGAGVVQENGEYAEPVNMIRSGEQNLKELENQLAATKGVVQCSQCGGFVPAGNMFCPHCGNKMEQPQQENGQQQGGFCTNCGRPLEPGSAFCTNCGTPVQK